MSTKRSVLSAATIGALVISLAACGGGGSSGGSDDDSLTMYAAEGGSSRAFQQAADDFEAATGKRVNVQVFSYGDLRDKQILELSGNNPAIDLVVVDGPIWLEELKRHLEPLDSYVESSGLDTDIYVQSYLNMSRSDDVLYGLPIRIAPWPLMYRQDLLDEVGATVPETLEELREVSLQIKDETGVNGLSLSLKQGNYIVAAWLPFLYGFGGDILTEDWSAAAFNDQAGQDSLKFLVDLYREDRVIPESAVDAEMDGVVTAMQQGLAAMTFTYAPYYLDMNNPDLSEHAGQFRVSAVAPYSVSSGLTTGATEISGWSFAISAKSEKKDLAWEFLQFAAGADEQLKLAVEANNTPTVESVFSEASFKDIFPESENLLEAARTGRQRPGIMQWAQVEDILARELSAAITGVKDPLTALSDAESAINSILQG